MLLYMGEICAVCSARGLARKKQIGKEAVVKIIDDAYRCFFQFSCYALEILTVVL